MDILKYKNKILLSVLVILIAVIGITVVSIINDNTIRLTTDTVTHEAGTELVLDAKKLFSADEEKAAKIKFDTSKVNTAVVGKYTAVATLNAQKIEFTVDVVDTTAPKVEFVNRVVFTNDIATEDCAAAIESVKDASTYQVRLVRFEKVDVLKTMDEAAIKAYEDKIPLPGKEEELKKLGTAEVPTTPGVYRSVMQIVDKYSNTAYEEVYVVLDKQSATVNEVDDMVSYVPADQLKAVPSKDMLDMSKFGGFDEVDGYLSADKLTFAFESKDKEKNEWMVTVSYTDRAGNINSSEFVLTLKEKAGANNTPSNGTGSTGQTPSTGTQNPSSGNSGSTGSGSTGSGSTNNKPTYAPEDLNKDGNVSVDEEFAHINEDEQACIDAGYGVVVSFNNGEYYMVLTHGNESYNNLGTVVLRNYLTERGLTGKVSSASRIPEKDYYWYMAYDIKKLITEDDDEFWN